MKIVTIINNQANFAYNLLKLSCALNNLELVVIVSKSDFRSRRVKDDLLRKYLKEQLDDEIILFTDGFDAFLLANEDEILAKFKEFKSDLVFSAETDCWPDKSLIPLYPISNSPYRFLNSGGYIGKVGIIKKFLNDNKIDLEEYPNSDQYLWTKRFLKNKKLISLDTKCEIFCTFSPEKGSEYLPKDDKNYTEYYKFMKGWFKNQFKIKNNRVFNNTTQTWPCQIHFNGKSKYLIDNEITNIIYAKIAGYKSPQIYYEE